MEINYFYCNCLFEAVKQWIKSPFNISIKKYGKFLLVIAHYEWIKP